MEIVDFSNVITHDATPEAYSMVQTFRSYGYNLETAMSDIIDNAISAKAKNIYIERLWRGGDSYITIKDDGVGMNSEEIIQALRPGSMNPLEERSITDLGRFGLGLKTASFSQCKRLSVFSKKKNYHSAFWTWDLDYIKECKSWQVLNWLPEEFKDELNSLKSGTIVVWSNLDRIIPSDTSIDDISVKMDFTKKLEKTKKHIAMTFHKFLESKKLKIYWCGELVEPWDPFCKLHKKTDFRPDELLSGGVVMKGYVLPHKNSFDTTEEYEKAEGINGWPAQQGFYVYRGDRLLLGGDWLGMFRKEEHYKLVRIEVNIPNTLDSNWQIDIKKSVAYPPTNCIGQMKQYAKDVRNRGCEVYRHRGKRLKYVSSQTYQSLWDEVKKDDKWSFKINRQHEIVKQAKSLAKEDPNKAINVLLQFIEETIPTKTIYINEASDEMQEKRQFEGVDESVVKSMIEKIYKNQLSQGKTTEEAKNYIRSTEPFQNFEFLIETLL